MKTKIFLILITIFTISQFSYANPFNIGNNKTFNPISFSNNGSDLAQKINKTKKYSDLINTLATSPNAEHALYLAIIYMNGISKPDTTGAIVKPDLKKAIFYFKKAIDLGNYNASAILGAMYLYHDKLAQTPNNIKKAKYYLNLALKNKIYGATTILADIYMNNEKNLKKAEEVLEIGAEHNVATAQFLLAILYNWGYTINGYTIKPNKIMANLLLTKACLNKNKTKRITEFCNSQYVIKKQKGRKKNENN